MDKKTRTGIQVALLILRHKKQKSQLSTEDFSKVAFYSIYISFANPRKLHSTAFIFQLQTLESLTYQLFQVL